MLVKAAVRVNGLTSLAVTKLDVLDECPEIKIGVGYRLDGRLLEEIPTDIEKLERCEPVYEDIPGWQQSTVGLKRYGDLPVNAQRYLERIEQICAVPIDVVSTGPERDETIVRRQPFD